MICGATINTYRCERVPGHVSHHQGYDHIGRYLSWPILDVEPESVFEPSDDDIEEYLAWRVGDDVRLVPNDDRYTETVAWLTAVMA